MAKQTFTTGQVLTAAQVNSLQSNDFNQTVSVKTAAYVLAAADKGTRIEFNTSGAVTCTVNTGLFDAGDTVIIQNRGAGDVTVTAGTATVDTAGSLVLSQYQSGTLYFISASASIFFAAAVGDLTAVTSGTGISISNAGGPVPTITNSMATTIDAKGDLVVGTGADTFARLAVGTNGHTLVADSSVSPTGLKWAAPSSPSYVGCALQKTATQSVANNTATFLTWNDELIDTNSFHNNSTNTERITIPVGYAGKYLVSALINYDIDAAGTRQLMGRLNGTTFFALVEQPPTSGAYTTLEFNVIRNFAEGDYIELRAYQDSGNSINILSGKDSQFSMTYLGA